MRKKSSRLPYSRFGQPIPMDQPAIDAEPAVEIAAPFHPLQTDNGAIPLTSHVVQPLLLEGRVHGPGEDRQMEPLPSASHGDWRDGDLDFPHGKKMISLRLDVDVLAFFQDGGKGYQTRINAVLRSYMKAKAGR